MTQLLGYFAVAVVGGIGIELGFTLGRVIVAVVKTIAQKGTEDGR